MPEISPDKQLIHLSEILHAYQSAVNEAAIVSITDLHGNILYINNKFVETSKYSSKELIGKNHRIINSGYHPEAFFKQLWETITKGNAWRGEIKNKAKDGTYYWVDTIITPVVDESNRIFQYLSVRNLITAQKDNEEKLVGFQKELLKREQQLIDAQQVAKTGSWYMNIAANTLEWSEETYRIFEISPGVPMTDELFVEKVHPEDRNMVHEKWLAGIKSGVYEAEHRIITPSGEKWVRERARMEFDPASELTGAIGTVQDITEKKKTENILKESESLYKNLFNNSLFPNAILEKETLKFLEVNEAAVQLYGYSREECLQLTIFDIRVADEHEKLKEQLEKGNFVPDRSIRTHKKKDGGIIQVEPFIGEISYKGKQALLITINDVTEKLRMQDELIQAKISRQKEISRASMEAQEKNRAEIGRELHDNVNQLLVASNMYLKNVHTDHDRDKELIEKSISILTTAIKEIRKLSWSLVPPSLKDLSLKDSIEELSQIFELTGTIVEFDINIREKLIPEGLKLNIFRIIQEQFNNIIKYADAGKLKIIMMQEADLLTLEICDNGKGFNRKEKYKGIGLGNIAHRAETYNGKANIESSPGKGCRVYIEFLL
ncbi:MAG TPA: PAS domain S-box protein [Chitinophagaceae bacterium]|nr:PAS domain S-box protein [Chitinophagaceae bacterium]